MGDAFPELKSQGELIQKVIREEEASFSEHLKPESNELMI